MREEVTAGEPDIVTAPGDPAAAADVEYRFPVEVEVRTTFAAADIDRAVQLALASLAGAMRNA